MKKLLTVFIFIFWFVSIASAGELITGAFGIKLGEPLDSSIAIYEGKEENTTVVNPIIPNKMFDEYLVGFTPITKTIIFIKASAETQKCYSHEYRGLVEILKNKYERTARIIFRDTFG